MENPIIAAGERHNNRRVIPFRDPITDACDVCGTYAAAIRINFRTRLCKSCAKEERIEVL